MPFKLVEGASDLSGGTGVFYFVLGLLVGASACVFFFLLFLGAF